MVVSYIGNGPPLLAQYGVESFNGGGTSFTLSKPATTATVLVFIDGVRQTPTDAYSVSGVTLTTTATTPSGTDNVTVQFLGDVVDFGEPSDDSVSTAKIQDDAVTADKLANSINTEITANTAKVTNATHTGDVTGATALTIATDAVDIPMLSATGVASATTFLRGDNAWASPSSGLNLITSATNNSAVAAWNFGDVFSATYDVYFVAISHLMNASSSQETLLKIGVSDLSSVESFGFSLTEFNSNNSTYNRRSDSETYIELNDTCGSGEPGSASFWIYNPFSSALMTSVVGQSIYYHTASSPSMQLVASSGNIGSATTGIVARVSIYGLAES
mgnify:CR=1 FL=1